MDRENLLLQLQINQFQLQQQQCKTVLQCQPSQQTLNLPLMVPNIHWQYPQFQYQNNLNTSDLSIPFNPISHISPIQVIQLSQNQFFNPGLQFFPTTDTEQQIIDQQGIFDISGQNFIQTRQKILGQNLAFYNNQLQYAFSPQFNNQISIAQTMLQNKKENSVNELPDSNKHRKSFIAGENSEESSKNTQKIIEKLENENQLLEESTINQKRELRIRQQVQSTFCDIYRPVKINQTQNHNNNLSDDHLQHPYELCKAQRKQKDIQPVSEEAIHSLESENFIEINSKQHKQGKQKKNVLLSQKSKQIKKTSKSNSAMTKKQANVSESKNIPKNFAYGIYTFIQKNYSQGLEKLFKKNNFTITKPEVMSVANVLPKSVSIKDLRDKWEHKTEQALNKQQINKVIRIMSYKFIKEQSLQYFLANPNIKKPFVCYQFKKRLMEALKDPDSFYSLS